MPPLPDNGGMDILKLGSVFAVAFFSFWASIPAGVALGIAPMIAGITAWVSYVAGVVLIVLIGEPIRVRLLRRFGGKTASNPNSLIRRAWDRFGLIGLALLAPATTGAQIGAIIGLSLGIPARRLMIAMPLGAALWAIALTLAVTLGLVVLK